MGAESITARGITGEPGAPGEGRLVVVSPHLDDAVLSCGRLLAARPRAAVVTVFAGRPPATSPVTPWDAAGGFDTGDDVVGRRRMEDAAACARLHANPIWLPFLDAQYGAEDQPVETVAGSIAAVVDALAPTTVAVPLGLHHADHVAASDAALAALGARDDLDVLLYADWPYSELHGAIPRRLQQLEHDGVALSPATDVAPDPGLHAPLKRRAVDCYASQRRAFAARGVENLRASVPAERYWRARAA